MKSVYQRPSVEIMPCPSPVLCGSNGNKKLLKLEHDGEFDAKLEYNLQDMYIPTGDASEGRAKENGIWQDEE